MFKTLAKKALYMALLFGAGCSAAYAQKKPKKGDDKGFYYQQNLKTPEEIRAIDNKIERFYHTFLGEFTNKAQADTSKHPILSIAQDLICIPVWGDRKGEYWLYLGWFKTGMLERPVGHTIYRLQQISPDTFQVSAYGLPDDEIKRSYEWVKPRPFAHLKPKDLKPPCINLAVPTQDGFQILPSMCDYPISDAIRHTQIEMILRPEQLNSFVAFFDANQREVFSYPRPNGMLLKRRDKNNPVLPRDFNFAKPAKSR